LDTNHEHSSQRRKKLKLNTAYLEELLQQTSPPDSYSFDYLWEKPWFQIYPKTQIPYTFTKKGQLYIDEEEALKSDTHWSITPKTGEITLESINPESAFEIIYESYNIKYLTSKWMIWERYDEDTGKGYEVFTTLTEFSGAQTPLQQLMEELQGESVSEKPNTYLILIIGVILFLIFILILSL